MVNLLKAAILTPMRPVFAHKEHAIVLLRANVVNLEPRLLGLLQSGTKYRRFFFFTYLSMFVFHLVEEGSGVSRVHQSTVR